MYARQLHSGCINHNKLHVNIGNKKALIFCLADWCGHCKNLIPEIKKLLKMIDHSKVSVFIIKEEDRDTMNKLKGLRGFPTIFFAAGSGAELLEHNGPRHASALMQQYGL